MSFKLHSFACLASGKKRAVCKWVQKLIQICLECSSKSKNHYKQLTSIVRVSYILFISFRNVVLSLVSWMLLIILSVIPFSFNEISVK